MDNRHVIVVGVSDELWGELGTSLEDEGLTADRFETSVPRLDRSSTQQTGAIVVGPAMVGSKRLDLCRQVRSSSLASITVISEGLAEVEEMRLVVAGACAIWYPPIRPRVMAAQLANRIDRVRSADPDAVLTYLRLRLDPIEHVATLDGHAVEFTKTEFDLLVLLMGHPRRVFTHGEISRWLWDDSWEVDHHRLEAHVCRLRKKIVHAGGTAIIGTVRGVGYRLIASSDMAGASHLAV